MKIIKVKKCPDCFYFDSDYQHNERVYFCKCYKVGFKIIIKGDLAIDPILIKDKIKIPKWCPLENYREMTLTEAKRVMDNVGFKKK